jgi:hypothetical protein
MYLSTMRASTAREGGALFRQEKIARGKWVTELPSMFLMMTGC